MNEVFPLARAADAYDRMMSGEARFRVVLTTGAEVRLASGLETGLRWEAGCADAATRRLSSGSSTSATPP